MFENKPKKAQNNDELIAYYNTQKMVNPVVINFQRRRVKMHYIFDYELEQLSTANNESSVNFGLFTATVASAFALWVTLLTAAFASPFTTNLFIAIAIMLTILSVYFLIRWRVDARTASRHLKSIRENQTEEIEIG